MATDVQFQGRDILVPVLIWLASWNMVHYVGSGVFVCVLWQIVELMTQINSSFLKWNTDVWNCTAKAQFSKDIFNPYPANVKKMVSS